MTMNDSYNKALDAAHRSIEDGSIDEFYTRMSACGVWRQIIAHSNKGWSTWYSAEWYAENKTEI